MAVDRITSAFVQAASYLGFEFQAGFSVTLGDGSIVRSAGRLPLFGSRSGVLVFAEDAKPSSASLQELERMGYLTSLLFPSYETFDAKHFSETLDDWGYFGAESGRPAWYTGKTWGADAAAAAS